MGKETPKPFVIGAEFMRMLLLHPRGWAVDEIKAYFQVGDRAVNDYLKRLRESRFSVYHGTVEQSWIHKVRVGDRTVVCARWEDDADPGVSSHDLLGALASVHFSAQLVRFMKGTPLARAIKTTQAQLKTSLITLNPGFRAILKDADRMFYVVPDAPKRYDDRSEIVQDLVDAIAFRREIRVDYRSSKGSSSRNLEPLTLLSYRSALYIVARKPGETQTKTFAVDRVTKVDLLKTRFTYPSPTDYHPAQLIDGSFGIYQDADARLHELRLRFATDRYAWLRNTIVERHWHPTQHFEDDDEGRLIMTLRVRSLTDVRRWLLGYGGKVEVLAPAALAAQLEEDRAR